MNANIDNILDHAHCKFHVKIKDYYDIFSEIISEMTQWCRDHIGAYYFTWDWVVYRGAKIFCFEKEHHRTWFILRFSEYL
jgi:hypothetical protein